MSNYSYSASAGNAQFNDDIAVARECLSRLSPSRADGRDSWIQVGMALQSTSDELLPDWIAFSRLSDKFREGVCEKTWRGFKPDKARSLGLGSLIRWAREDSGDADFGKASRGQTNEKFFATLQAAIDNAVARANGTLGGRWTYHKPDGSPHFWIVRINHPGVDAHGKQKKEFRPIHQNGDRFLIADPPGPLPLHRVHLLPEDGPIIVVEGEKAAEAGAQIGLATTTSAHGSQSPAKTNWQPLAGRSVILLPDNDPEGIKYVLAVGGILGKLDSPAKVRVLEVLGVPPKGDLHDFIELRRAAGGTDLQIRGEVETLLKSAVDLEGFAGAHQGASAVFPDPIPLPDNKPPVMAFDSSLLPVRMAPWIVDIADRMQCAMDYLFAALMVALAAVLGRRIGIRPKRLDSWLVVANLWGAAVGRPGILKSPAIEEVLKPLKRLEIQAKKDFEKAVKETLALQQLFAARQKVKKKELQDVIEEGGDGARLAAELAEPGPTPPARRRLIVVDSTVEKLGEILNTNTNGVLSFRDELVGLIRSLDKEGQEGARGFYLQAWNGDSRYCYDRIGRGTIDIEAAILSVFGSIQPGPLTKYLLAGAVTGLSDDGLLQRFQVVVYPDQPRGWTNHDRVPDKDARETAYEVFLWLDKLKAESVGAETEMFEPDGIPFLRFSPDAQVVFDAWRTELELRLRSGDLEEIFESHLAKFRSLIPSLALIYHLVDVGHGPVGRESLERAIRASIYLESHARRLYATTLSPEVAAAHALAKKLKAKRVSSPFTLRDVYQSGWSLLATSDEVQKAVTVLVDHDWLVEEKGRDKPVGPQKTRYHINPRIWDPPSGGTGKTPKTPPNPNENGPRPPEGTGNTGKTAEPEEETGERGSEGTPNTGKTQTDENLGDLPVPSGGHSIDREASAGPPPKDILDQVTETFGGSVMPDPPPPRPASPPRPPRATRSDPTPTLGFDGEEEVPYD